MEWLTPDKETEFVVDEEKLKARASHAVENKQVLSSLDETTTDVERRNLLISALNSVALDDWSARKELPPYTKKESDEYLDIVSDYVAAQNQLFLRLEKEPFIYPDELPYIHSILVEKNEDIPARDKGCFRSPYSSFIQTPYFDATPGAKVRSEMAMAFMQYGFMTGDFEKDIVNIAKLHAQIVRIQPFMCANKRMAFLVTNALLKLDGFTPISLCRTQEENAAYLGALKEAILNRDVTSLTGFFLDKELEAQQDQLDEATEQILISKRPDINLVD